MRTSSYEKMLPFFPAVIAEPLAKIPKSEQIRVQEIRLRAGRPLQIISGGQAHILTKTGGYTRLFAEGIPVSRLILDTVFQSVCEHSIHSYQEEIRQGFVTAAGGCRVGLCATAVMKEGKIEALRYISGMNVRIACEMRGCAESLAAKVFGQSLCGLLVAGAPTSGKTTILRDLCRILGERYRVSVIDERSELAAMQHGESPFDMGVQTDVYAGFPKSCGIETAVRVMSPEVLVCDELGGTKETEALLPALHTGVHLVASAHAGSIAELYARPQIKRLLDANAFSYTAMLGTGAQCGQVMSLHCVGHAL